jgi:heme/copper-type cytochrome/quinol oxidase subunit 3
MADTAVLPAPPDTRPRTILVGASLASGAVFMFFVALVSYYAGERQQAIGAGEGWLPSDDISIVPGNMMFFTMWMSALTMGWALVSLKNNDRINAYVALGLTAMFGFAVMNQTVFYYNDVGVALADGQAEMLFFIVTGSFLAMMGAAILFLAFMTFRALAGQFTDRNMDAMSAAAIFWWTTVAVYMIVWYTIYITK